MREAGMKLRKPGRPKQDLRINAKYSQEDLYNLIKAKRDAGLTYRKIANDLSSQKNLNKSDSLDSHPMMIKRILENFYR